MPMSKQKTAAAKPKNQRSRHPRSYTPLSDALNQPFTFADTELAKVSSVMLWSDCSAAP